MELVEELGMLEQIARRLGRGHLGEAHFHVLFGMRRDDATERAREDLATQADAEIRNVGLQDGFDMADLASDTIEIGVVIGAHRAAEHDYTGIFRDIQGQVATKTGAPAFQHVSAPFQQLPDPSGGGVLLMQNDQNRILASLPISHRIPIRQFP